MLFFFFFKQKTAYEMRISDWSSDVCSSDLNLSMSGNATVRAAAKEHLNLIRAHAGKNGGKVPAYALDDIRQNINGMLAKHAPNGAVGSQEGAKYGPDRKSVE